MSFKRYIKVIEMRNLNIEEEYAKESIEYLKNTDIKKRKKYGQYFTPKSIKNSILKKLPKKDNPSILDPACGSGEFLISCVEYFNNPKLTGFEIDKTLCSISKKIVPKANIECIDALIKYKKIKNDITQKYDYVIGNPPYFEFKPSKETREEYKDIINGRVNIFSIFIKLGLELLKPGGYLAYVIPPSMNNGAFFSKLRDYITKNARIEYLHIVEGVNNFHMANQKVMLLILKKTKNKSSKYIFTRNEITIFTEDKNFLRKQYENSVSLEEIGYEVKTGSVTWNEHKDKLTNDKNEGTLLIWSSNIKENKIVIPTTKKPQYIKNIAKEKIMKTPAIVVNRITGAAKKLNMNAAIIKGEYVCENHVNVIYKTDVNTDYTLEYIHKILIDENTMKIMRLVTGNTQVSKTELKLLLPIKKK